MTLSFPDMDALSLHERDRSPLFDILVNRFLNIAHVVVSIYVTLYIASWLCYGQEIDTSRTL